MSETAEKKTYFVCGFFDEFLTLIVLSGGKAAEIGLNRDELITSHFRTEMEVDGWEQMLHSIEAAIRHGLSIPATWHDSDRLVWA